MNKPYFRPARLALQVLALALSLTASRAHAQANPNPPERLTYQGYVVDANGNPLGAANPKNYDIVFRVWNDATATAAANRLWTEQQTVTVDKGYFSVLLGEGASIGEARPALSTLFTGATASDRWVGLTVKGIGAGTPPGDVDILPRIRLLTSPYAFLATKALNVDGSALLTGTIPDARLSANVPLKAGGNTFTGNQVFNNNVGIGVANPTAKLDVNGDIRSTYLTVLAGDTGSEGGEILLKGAGTYSDVFVDNFAGRMRIFNPTGGEMFSLLNNGNLGLGVTGPDSRLQVGGNLKVSGGSLYLDNQMSLKAKNSTGTYEDFLVPRTANNGSYVNYGSGGLSFRTPDNTDRMVVNSNGWVGVGTSSPSAPFHLVSNNPYPQMRVSAGAGAPFGAFLSVDATATAGGKDYLIYSTGGSAGEGRGNLCFKNYTDNFLGMTMSASGALFVTSSNMASFFTSPSSYHGSPAANLKTGGLGDLVSLKTEGGDGKVTIWNERTHYFKTFIIPHPVSADKYLVHAAVEGPEVAVFYRGSARLDHGRATIRLPDYFEALTEKDGRTVQLTAVGGFDRLAVRAQGSARIVDGRFEVYSDNLESTQEFDWEVMARRGDGNTLVVEPSKSEITVHGDGPYTYATPRLAAQAPARVTPPPALDRTERSELAELRAAVAELKAQLNR